MALRAGYYGVKRRIWEALQATTAKNVQDITDIWSNNTIMGAKNLLPNNLVTTSSQSVTFTHDADGGISLSGTAGANVDAAIYDTRDSGELWRGLTLIVSKGLDNANIKILVNAYTDTTYVKTLVDLDSGTESAPITIDYSGYNRVRVTAYVKSGTNTTGKKIYPMFRLATDPDDTYAPYAMTNRELTESVYFKGVLSSGVDLNDIKEAGIYSFTSTPTSAPTGVDNAVLIVTPVTAGNVNQTIIKTASAKSEIYSREYGGSPASWFGWYKYTGTAVTQAKAPEDIAVDPEISEEEPEVVKKSTRKKITKTEEEE